MLWIVHAIDPNFNVSKETMLLVEYGILALEVSCSCSTFPEETN